MKVSRAGSLYVSLHCSFQIGEESLLELDIELLALIDWAIFSDVYCYQVDVIAARKKHLLNSLLTQLIVL